MNSSTIAQSIAVSLLILTAVAVALAWAGWHAARKWGTRGLVIAWCSATLVMTIATVARIRQQQLAFGIGADEQHLLRAFLMFFPMWAIGLAAVALVIRARVRASDTQFSTATAARSSGALLAGFVGYSIVYVVLDAAGVISRP